MSIQSTTLLIPRHCPPEKRYIRNGIEDTEIPEGAICVALHGLASEPPFSPLPEKIQRLFIRHQGTLPISFAVPTGLTNLRRLSLHGIHFTSGSEVKGIPNLPSLKLLEFTQCQRLKLTSLDIQILRLEDCDWVYLLKSALPKIALFVKNVKFVTCKAELPKTMTVLHLENTDIGGAKLEIPQDLKVLYFRDFRCKTIIMLWNMHIKEISQLPENLETLELNYSAINSLPSRLPPGLRRLDISNTQIPKPSEPPPNALVIKRTNPYPLSQIATNAK